MLEAPMLWILGQKMTLKVPLSAVKAALVGPGHRPVVTPGARKSSTRGQSTPPPGTKLMFVPTVNRRARPSRGLCLAFTSSETRLGAELVMRSFWIV